jgi:transcriptional regulator with XRE-family HTH domain
LLLATRRQIVNLTNLGKLTQAEIAETFHVSRGTVRKIMKFNHEEESSVSNAEGIANFQLLLTITAPVNSIRCIEGQEMLNKRTQLLKTHCVNTKLKKAARIKLRFPN